ncbi:CBS domain-containing protein CBSCBSPB5 [Camellia lanceoleosa]|uniref:CBS domain-containing protein CBSCBSPB5 n=1 Tax=Camellia lanceoleosa TaxID=1840588 RepID=A0ACC0FLR0_9ERIC|nr:CBS domain-containing protein CBSCBSPB5 [Camellia lanceoleosa]
MGFYCLTPPPTKGNRQEFLILVGNQVVVQPIEERLSALGNCIACNDYIALTHTDLDKMHLELSLLLDLKADGVAVAVVDVLHITHAAIATVGSNAGVSNDSSPNMMQKFWDSAMALSPDKEEDAESDSSFKLASESIETTRSLPYPSSIVPNTFAFKIQDKNGRMHRFNCGIKVAFRSFRNTSS